MSWNDLVAAALVGTERSPFVVSESVSLRFDNERPADALLKTAAVEALRQRAGFLPVADLPDSLAPAPSDSLPVCPARAAFTLALILSDPQKKVLLFEWLTLLRRSNRRLPEAHLSEVLSRGRMDTGLRSLIIPVLGERGYWLASLRDEWSYAVASLDPASWQHAPLPARIQYLLALRETEPDQARTMLAETWDQERVPAKSSLLTCLAVNLSMADEPFLAGILAERSSRLRSEATQLLARLSDSRLVARMITLTSPLLRWRNDSLVASLPRNYTEEMESIGIAKTPSQKVGERAWWLQQMLAFIPPSYWCGQWNAPPEKILQKAQANNLQSVLEAGWHLATLNHQDQAWAEALFRQAARLTDLLSILPPERAEALIAEKVENNKSEEAALNLLLALKRPWSVPYTRTFLKVVSELLGKQVQSLQYSAYKALMTEAGYYIPVSLFEEVKALVDRFEQANLANLTDILSMRKRMVEELSE